MNPKKLSIILVLLGLLTAACSRAPHDRSATGGEAASEATSTPISTQEELDAKASREITDENADEAFEDLSREIEADE